MAPAKTGREVINRREVTARAHSIRGRRSIERTFVVREQIIVVKKLIEPRIEEIPAMWREKIAKSTEIPEWNLISDRGGYTVQPVPTPESNIEDKRRNIKEGTNNQKERLLRRGKAISATPSMRGISQFPKPPIEIGITMKKIMMKA
jgi:hypothetical protein